ncbi:hypothetical protein MH117_16025 [Paenibacillus sp. ACRRX]|uniref:hypothetical protein n=1 Tax=unclassified Paenibacillus TaxID=185978 RepID=UPI001EF4DFAE|nr:MULTISPECIES: hypothetical protein [unclassified Paenibacillus]MCG7408926.1 hypothetical protein [Paenibacillus sp. ACRRX]MDK8182163.1 hypothetical protein [Paenibacillus sp. UMB4589-SE434]
MKLVTTYNCVIATIYNYLSHVQKLEFELEALIFSPPFFKLVNSYDGFLTSAPFEEVVTPFLQQADCHMVFPNVSSPQAAMMYAHEHLRTKGIMPVAINLRYDVLEPLPFDNDAWHIHIIVGREGTDRFKMYDQFEDKYYVVDEQHLMKAIDTPFNYRNTGQFTPFMQMDVTDREATQRKLSASGTGLSSLRHAVEHYPLHINLHMGSVFLDGISRYAVERPKDSDIYKLMNYPHIICKSRHFVAEYMKRCMGGVKLTGLEQLQSGWERFRRLLGMALHRQEREAFIRLAQEYEQLIYLELHCLQEVMSQYEAGIDV